MTNTDHPGAPQDRPERTALQQLIATLRERTWLAPVSAEEMNHRDRWLADQIEQLIVPTTEASDILAWLNLEQKQAARWTYGTTGVYRFTLTGPELMRIRRALEQSGVAVPARAHHQEGEYADGANRNEGHADALPDVSNAAAIDAHGGGSETLLSDVQDHRSASTHDALVAPARAAEWQPLTNLLSKWNHRIDLLREVIRLNVENGPRCLNGSPARFAADISYEMAAVQKCADELEKLLPPGALAGDSNSKT